VVEKTSKQKPNLSFEFELAEQKNDFGTMCTEHCVVIVHLGVLYTNIFSFSANNSLHTCCFRALNKHFQGSFLSSPPATLATILRISIALALTLKNILAISDIAQFNVILEKILSDYT
jgi:hypothetical protein